MSFRLLGVEVEVQIGFWVMAALLGFMRYGWPRHASEAPIYLVWVGVVLLSVLVHEYGHALAFRRHRIRSEITLHWMGGLTRPHALLPLGRLDNIIISLAGPFAGFFLAGIIYAAVRAAPHAAAGLPPLAREGIGMLLDVNIGWGLFNLIPILPFDGGHVLQHALGPKRARMSAGISTVISILVAAYALSINWYWLMYLAGMSAIRSFQRWSNEPELSADDLDRQPPRPREEAMPGEVAAMLIRARQALEDERLDEARALASGVLLRDPPPPPRAGREAHEIVGWAALLGGDLKEAASALARARKLGEPDAALAGALHRALGEARQARKVLEAARAAGDDRKEVVGPLIQILIEQGEVPRAAAIALDIVDSLSEDDARKMAEIAFDHGAFDWAGRLYEAVFRRNGEGEDAYGAARANAKGGNLERALELLRSAVEAGFSDRARAWSDSALESLRNGPLDSVLPRP